MSVHVKREDKILNLVDLNWKCFKISDHEEP